MTISIQDAIKQLLTIVHALQHSHPKKKFTLDGRLVGDLGEVLVESAYDIKLHEGLQKHHDGVTSDGRNVQIKATMKESLTFPGDHIPDYYLGIKIHDDGTFTEIFNGPGEVAWETIKDRKAPKTNLHSIGISTLRKISQSVKIEDRIPLRDMPYGNTPEITSIDMPAKVTGVRGGQSMKNASTCGEEVSFRYTGSVREGVVIFMSSKDSAKAPTKAKVSAEFFQAIINTFAGREVWGGFSMTNPPPGGFGKWVRYNSAALNSQKLSPRHGSFIAGILRAEGLVSSSKEGKAVKLRFLQRDPSRDP